MRKTLTLMAVLLCMGSSYVSAQQNPMFTKYMFNSLVFNPAYAGSRDFMSINLLHRTQWWGIPGGPQTQSFSIHSPLANERVGVGLSAVNDVIGPTRSMQAFLSYAYRIPIGKGKLSIGIQGGAMNWRADWSEVDLQDTGDDAFSEVDPSYWLPNFGAGIYYYTRSFYVGFSSPQLIEYDLREDNINTAQWARQYRHYFFTAGAAIPVAGDNVVFRPSLLVKNVGLLSSFNKDEAYQGIGAPTEFDIDVSLFFYQTLWVGASFRSAVEGVVGDSSSFDSIDIWAAYYLANGLRIGAAYDYTLTELQTAAKGSFEIMLGYEFDYRTNKAVTPRYF
ncbi:MAG: type IX secretion system membrane protein PorP/SprF [Bacteroidota bacterium]